MWLHLNEMYNELVPYNEVEHSQELANNISQKYFKKYTNRLFPFSLLSKINIEKNDLYLLREKSKRKLTGMIVYRRKYLPFHEGFATYIYGVEVFKTFRGKGYGNELMELSLQHLKRRGIKTVYLAVDEKNKIAVQLYKKYGFTVVRTKGDTQLILKRKLHD